MPSLTRTSRRALLALPTLALPAAAQPAPQPAPRPAPRPAPQPAPRPVTPPAPRRAPPPPQLAPGVNPLPGGGWRLTFARDEDRPTPQQRLTLMDIGKILSAGTTGRVTLWAEVAGGEDVSELRRLALRRALAVREAMALGGLPETRVDLRPLGRTEAGRDAVDIMPPSLVRP